MQNKSNIKKGFFIAVLYIVFNSIIDIAKMHHLQWVDLVAWFIIIVGVVVSVHLFAKSQGFTEPFASLFSYGFKTTAVATCLIFIYVLLMVYVISPNIFIEKANVLAALAKKNQGAIDEIKLKANTENAIKILKLMQIAISVILTLFLGLIGSVIGAVATKKNIQQLN